MAKKKTTPIAPPTMLTLTLPNDGPMPRTGTLLAQKGDVGQLRRFEYRNLAEVSTALKEALLVLNELAKQPSMATANPAAESPEDDDQAESATSDEPAEFQEAAMELFVSAHAEEIIAAEMPVTDQLSLF